MAALTIAADEISGFHESLCRDWINVDGTLVEPDMILFLPEEFPWQPMTYRGVAALSSFREALDVMSEGTFESVTEGITADESVVAIRCRERAARHHSQLEWSSLWIYVLAGGRIREARVLHALPSDDITDFWCV
jgi:ketosteroid isomerase-like protein